VKGACKGEQGLVKGKAADVSTQRSLLLHWSLPHVAKGEIDWCCFYYFVRNSLVALLQALCANINPVRFFNFRSDYRWQKFSNLSFYFYAAQWILLLHRSVDEALAHCLWLRTACRARQGRPRHGACFFFGLLCRPATQLARQLHQEHSQVVCSKKEARKRLTESNGTPAFFLFWFVATQPARQLHQEHTQVVCSNREHCFWKHCECIPQKCTHLERLPPIAF